MNLPLLSRFFCVENSLNLFWTSWNYFHSINVWNSHKGRLEYIFFALTSGKKKGEEKSLSEQQRDRQPWASTFDHGKIFSFFCCCDVTFNHVSYIMINWMRDLGLEIEKIFPRNFINFHWNDQTLEKNLLYPWNQLLSVNF